jgi:hypothetical protein
MKTILSIIGGILGLYLMYLILTMNPFLFIGLIIVIPFLLKLFK